MEIINPEFIDSCWLSRLNSNEDNRIAEQIQTVRKVIVVKVILWYVNTRDP